MACPGGSALASIRTWGVSYYELAELLGERPALYEVTLIAFRLQLRLQVRHAGTFTAASEVESALKRSPGSIHRFAHQKVCR